MKRTTRALAGGLAVLALTTSCYGPFNATRQLHKWNDDISDNEWVVEGVFLVAVIIPVYGIFMLGDAIIFNSIEFWGGENPINPPTAKLDDDDSKTLRIENVAATDGDSVRASIVSAAGVEDLCTETDEQGVTTLTRADGSLLVTLEPLPNGELVMRDGLGREVARGPSSALR